MSIGFFYMMTNQLRSYETQVLLLGWRNDFPKVDPVNLFEIFSGAANTTKWWWLVCTKFIRSSMMVLYTYQILLPTMT